MGSHWSLRAVYRGTVIPIGARIDHIRGGVISPIITTNKRTVFIKSVLRFLPVFDFREVVGVKARRVVDVVNVNIVREAVATATGFLVDRESVVVVTVHRPVKQEIIENMKYM